MSAGLKIVESKLIQYDLESAKKHYAVHEGKPFFDNLIKYITSDVAYGMIVEGGEDCIEKIRALCGSTKNPDEGTIRYEVPKMLGLPLRITENVVHSSDSKENAEYEIAIFKNLKEEILNI